MCRFGKLILIEIPILRVWSIQKNGGNIFLINIRLIEYVHSGYGIQKLFRIILAQDIRKIIQCGLGVVGITIIIGGVGEIIITHPIGIDQCVLALTQYRKMLAMVAIIGGVIGGGTAVIGVIIIK
jgi:hypothetical protein